jgi:hypothetical protein
LPKIKTVEKPKTFSQRGISMRSSGVAAIFLVLLGVSVGFAQTGRLGGIVSDTSGALIPGVTITATNTDTGVVTTTVTNETGS